MEVRFTRAMARLSAAQSPTTQVVGWISASVLSSIASSGTGTPAIRLVTRFCPALPYHCTVVCKVALMVLVV